MKTKRVGSAVFGSLVLCITLTVAAPPAFAGRDCNKTSSGLVPLTDLGTGVYQGETGGLYPGGSNNPPTDHLELGLRLAEDVVPRAEDGTPDPDGQVVMISIGVSNTLAEFNAFEELVANQPSVNNDLLLVNGAQVGRALGQWALRSSETTWNRVDRNLRDSGATPAQVQVAWIMLPPETRGPVTLAAARDDIKRFVVVLQTAKQRYPNLELAYLSSRIYGGYIDDENSEPNAYNHGFEIKWLIEGQLDGSLDLNADPGAGPVVAPWMAWGPYLWADGVNPRRDGLVWLCDDYAGDGVHPGEGATLKVATQLVDHFISDPTAKSWFLDSGGSDPAVAIPDTTASNSEAVPDTTTTTRIERGDRQGQGSGQAQNSDRQRNGETASPAVADRNGAWPTSTLVGVGLAGLILGAFAATFVRKARESRE